MLKPQIYKPNFNPVDYNFIYSNRLNDTYIWRTEPMPDRKNLIGSYSIEFNSEDNYWTIYELYLRTEKLDRIQIYNGWIPDNTFGFELLKNLRLILPVVQREIKIEELL